MRPRNDLLRVSVQLPRAYVVALERAMWTYYQRAQGKKKWDTSAIQEQLKLVLAESGDILLLDWQLKNMSALLWRLADFRTVCGGPLTKDCQRAWERIEKRCIGATYPKSGPVRVVVAPEVMRVAKQAG